MSSQPEPDSDQVDALKRAWAAYVDSLLRVNPMKQLKDAVAAMGERPRVVVRPELAARLAEALGDSAEVISNVLAPEGKALVFNSDMLLKDPTFRFVDFDSSSPEE